VVPEHKFNLYSYDQGSKQVEQLTKFTEFDVMWPSLGPDAIVFENAGHLYTFDFDSRQAKKLTISVPGETDETMRHWTSVSKLITDFDISPDGKRAVFAASWRRCSRYTAKEGSARNLTRTPGIREKGLLGHGWALDCLCFRSHRRGRTFHRTAGWLGQGTADHQRLQSFKFNPGGLRTVRKLAWGDKDLRLWYIDVGDKETSRGRSARYDEITNYSWSSRQQVALLRQAGREQQSAVLLYSLTDKRSRL